MERRTTIEMNQSQAARYLGVSRWWLQRHKQLLHPRKRGREKVYDLNELIRVRQLIAKMLKAS